MTSSSDVSSWCTLRPCSCTARTTSSLVPLTRHPHRHVACHCIVSLPCICLSFSTPGCQSGRVVEEPLTTLLHINIYNRTPCSATAMEARPKRASGDTAPRCRHGALQVSPVTGPSAPEALPGPQVVSATPPLEAWR